MIHFTSLSFQKTTHVGDGGQSSMPGSVLASGSGLDRISDFKESQRDGSKAVPDRVLLPRCPTGLHGRLHCEVFVVAHECSSRRCDTTYNTTGHEGADNADTGH